MDGQPTNVEDLSPSFYIAICILCSVSFDWLWLPRTFILLAMTFQSTRQESPWATKASQAGSTKKSLDVQMSSNVLEAFPECAYQELFIVPKPKELWASIIRCLLCPWFDKMHMWHFELGFSFWIPSWIHQDMPLNCRSRCLCLDRLPSSRAPITLTSSAAAAREGSGGLGLAFDHCCVGEREEG